MSDLVSPPGNRREALRGDRQGQYSIRINEQWRVCFLWREGGAWEAETTDYHQEHATARKLRPAHPGEILSEDFREPYALSRNKLALDLRVAVTRIPDIIAEHRGITAGTALCLARSCKTTPRFWLNRQTKTKYDCRRRAACENRARRAAH